MRSILPSQPGLNSAQATAPRLGASTGRPSVCQVRAGPSQDFARRPGRAAWNDDDIYSPGAQASYAGGRDGGQQGRPNRRDSYRSFDEGSGAPGEYQPRGDDQQRGGYRGGRGGGYGGRGRGGGGRGGGGQRFVNRDGGATGEGSYQRTEGGFREGGFREVGFREGGRGGGRGGGQGGGERQPWLSLSPEQLALRRELSQLINGAAGWRDLATVLEQRGSQMDAENIANILTRVADNRRPEQPDERAGFDGLLSALLGWVLAMLPTFRPKHTAAALAALARLELYSEEVVKGLLDRAQGQIVNFSTAETAALISSTAKLGHVPTPEFMAEFFTKTVPRLPAFMCWELANLLSGLARLGAIPTTAWMDACGVAAGKQASSFKTAREYTLLVVSLASLGKSIGWQPPQEVVDALFARGPETFMREMQREGQDSRAVGKFTMSDMAQVLYALSNFSVRPQAAWFNSAYNWMLGRFWEPAEFSTICMYLGRYLQQPAPPAFVERLQKFIIDKRSELTSDGAASIIYLMALSGLKPKDKWLDDVVIYVKNILPNCSLVGLEMVYNALPLLGSGYRLNEVVTDAANRYNAAVAAQQPQQQEAQYTTDAQYAEAAQ